MPTVDETIKPKENTTQTESEIIQVAPEQLIMTEQQITKYKSKYNKDKYKQMKVLRDNMDIGGTGDQILLANGDTIDKDKLDYEPIENARYSSIAYGIGTQHNIPLNAVMFAQKVIGHPICWNGAIPIDCFINPNGNVVINTMCQLSFPDDFCVQVCDSYALHNQSS
ncbi:MAG: hypothetical protein EZS28_025374 [Streblomastix strix]|uniref:Uncharacterized protein n=1 Tax=Streblomastix strix TaxID=222440 RepID=A0A5J4V985_9EUKA|nr:MAG: hypothetical protein EZS28_025374 [Streblomastix strix]